MPNPEVLSWVLSGALFVITCIGGALYKMLREEAKDHSDKIEKKASSDRLSEVESRWQGELIEVRQNNKELISELKSQHNRELDAMGTRFSEQLRTMETNILRRIELIVATVNVRQVS